MRVIPRSEKKQRGCPYCKNVTKVRHEGVLRTACPYDECPYKVLDNYESYEDYMESEDCKIQVDEFFKTFPGFWSFMKNSCSYKHRFSDRDSNIDL